MKNNAGLIKHMLPNDLQTHLRSVFRVASNDIIVHVHRAALEGWLTCNFTHVYADSFRDTQFLNFSRKTAPLAECLKESSYLPPFRLLQTCVDKLQTLCKNSSLHIIKTIRTPAPMARLLSKHIKDLKVIYLVRDPRSVVWSQAMLSLCDKSIPGLFKCATYYCKKSIREQGCPAIGTSGFTSYCPLRGHCLKASAFRQTNVRLHWTDVD